MVFMLWCKHTLHFTALCKQDPCVYVCLCAKECGFSQAIAFYSPNKREKNAHLQVQLDGIHGGVSTLCLYV